MQPSPDTSYLPAIIRVNDRNLHEIADDAQQAVQAAFADTIFLREGKLVRLATTEQQRPFITPLSAPALRDHMSQAAQFVTMHVTADSIVMVYRSTVFWTPSDLKLGCISQDTPLLMSHLSRCFVSMPSNQPGFIVLTLELVQRQAEFFHAIKGREP